MARAKNSSINNPTSKQVITMPEAGSITPVRRAAPLSNPAPMELEDQIRRRAYELYQERGGTPGLENEDWLRAEHEVLARKTRSQSA
jgi:hypothetical protein